MLKKISEKMLSVALAAAMLSTGVTALADSGTAVVPEYPDTTDWTVQYTENFDSYISTVTAADKQADNAGNKWNANEVKTADKMLFVDGGATPDAAKNGNIFRALDYHLESDGDGAYLLGDARGKKLDDNLDGTITKGEVQDYYRQTAAVTQGHRALKNFAVEYDMNVVEQMTYAQNDAGGFAWPDLILRSGSDKLVVIQFGWYHNADYPEKDPVINAFAATPNADKKGGYTMTGEMFENLAEDEFSISLNTDYNVRAAIENNTLVIQMKKESDSDWKTVGAYVDDRMVMDTNPAVSCVAFADNRTHTAYDNIKILTRNGVLSVSANFNEGDKFLGVNSPRLTLSQPVLPSVLAGMTTVKAAGEDVDFTLNTTDNLNFDIEINGGLKAATEYTVEISANEEYFYNGDTFSFTTGLLPKYTDLQAQASYANNFVGNHNYNMAKYAYVDDNYGMYVPNGQKFGVSQTAAGVENPADKMLYNGFDKVGVKIDYFMESANTTSYPSLYLILRSDKTQRVNSDLFTTNNENTFIKIFQDTLSANYNGKALTNSKQPYGKYNVMTDGKYSAMPYKYNNADVDDTARTTTAGVEKIFTQNDMVSVLALLDNKYLSVWIKTNGDTEYTKFYDYDISENGENSLKTGSVGVIANGGYAWIKDFDILTETELLEIANGTEIKADTGTKVMLNSNHALDNVPASLAFTADGGNEINVDVEKKNAHSYELTIPSDLSFGTVYTLASDVYDVLGNKVEFSFTTEEDKEITITYQATDAGYKAVAQNMAARYQMITAIYKTNGASELQRVIIPEKGVNETEFTLAEGEEARSFVWDSLENIIPMTMSVPYPAN